MIKKLINILLLTIALSLGLFLGYQQTRPPKAPENLDETPITLAEAHEEPDFQLMLTHIREMAGEVHSVGSPGLARTQKYLMDQIEGMGYDYRLESYDLTMEEVQDLLKILWDDADISSEEIRQRAGLGEEDNMPLNNIMVHVDAPDTDKTVIFMAHTDSVKEGPGAFDDIVSVAALLEGLRSVQSQELKRDLVFLFTDGEEQGLLGAGKFIQDHPEYKDKTSLVMNLEARGNSGILVLFQTSENNLELIKTYREVVSYPFSASFVTAIYNVMPNDTDLSHFLQEGYPGVNFAVAENPRAYHTEIDNYETFNRDSAFQYMNTTVELVNYLAHNEEVNLESEENSVHFPFFPGKLMILSENKSNILAHATVILFFLLLLYLVGSKRIKVSQVLITFGIQLLCMILSGLITFGLLQILFILNENFGYFSEYLITWEHFGSKSDMLLAILLLTFVVLTVIIMGLTWRRKVNDSQKEKHYAKLMGVLLLPAVLGEILVWIFPSSTYLFSLSVLAGLIAIAVSLILPGLAPLVTALAIFLSPLIYGTLVYALFVALLINGAFITIPVTLLPVTVIFGEMNFMLGLSD